MPNPDMSKDLNIQFDYVNNFVCTRLKRNDKALVVESFLNYYWVETGNIKEFEFIQDYTRILRMELLNNAIYLAMNS